jgi:ABC-type amino acid transport substrate-binding protein
MLVLAYIDPFPPFSFTGAEGPEGVALSIVRESFARVGIDCDFRPLPQPEVREAVFSGAVDGCACLGITEERCATWAFSAPYLWTGGALFTARSLDLDAAAGAPGSALSPPGRGPVPAASPEEFRGRVIATPESGPLIGPLRASFPEVEVLAVTDYESALRAVIQGRAAAAALNLHVGAQLAERLWPGRFWMPDRAYLPTALGVGFALGREGTWLAHFARGFEAAREDGTWERVMSEAKLPTIFMGS